MTAVPQILLINTETIKETSIVNNINHYCMFYDLFIFYIDTDPIEDHFLNELQ